jgi:hypothetical protein
MKVVMEDLCILLLLGCKKMEELSLGITIHIKEFNKLVNSMLLKLLFK